MVGAVLLLIGADGVLSGTGVAQALSGAFIGTVKDAQGGVVRGALVRLTSPALIGGQETVTTNEKGQMRFPILPPGDYTLDIERQGFASYHEAEIRIGAGATIERTAVLQLAGVAESIVVEGAGSRIEARDPGFGTRFGPEDVRAIPTRRNSMFDLIKAAPGISPTAPSSGTNASGTNNTISAFGSSTNENHFLSTARTSPVRATASRAPSQESISSRKCRSNPLAPQPSSATRKAPSSTSSPVREVRATSTTRRTTRSWRP
jgi:hypothetical protein